MLFRGMTPDVDGLPRVGRSARSLGVRVPDDIKPDTSGVVHPGQGGLSVAPCSMWKLPHHRRPLPMGRGSTGSARDCVYSLPFDRVPIELTARPDPMQPFKHAFIEPGSSVVLEDYDNALAGTRTQWQRVWP